MLASWKIWVARLAVLVVFFWNVLCALQFVVAPQDYMGAYGLSGVEGAAALRGLGIAFLMWNATYPAFIINPQRFRVLGWVVLAQQIIGLGGESLIFFTLPGFTSVLAGSILRFMVFDAAGLILIAVALGLTKKPT